MKTDDNEGRKSVNRCVSVMLLRSGAEPMPCTDEDTQQNTRTNEE